MRCQSALGPQGDGVGRVVSSADRWKDGSPCTGRKGEGRGLVLEGRNGLRHRLRDAVEAFSEALPLVLVT